ncbi:hypothetical protein [Saccharopolyspora rosea]|uniref:PE family protein n=1 Tax=Saccharopolyspora rosea TaxID=524884 RepID=A0ABW3FWH8_9PSEU|nr:hypothetical protein [Saccharopolyspora rosea]
MTTPAPPPPPPAPGGPGQSITVNKDNVLQARKVILQAVEHAHDRLEALQYDLAISAPADDRISSTAAAVWNGNLVLNPDSHYNRLRQYVDNVQKLAEQLEEAAKQYGYTEEEITASFNAQARQM